MGQKIVFSRCNRSAGAAGALFIAAVAASMALAAPKPDYHWQRTDASLALLDGGRIVWQFNYRKEEGKPYFHPLALADGTELTWLRPPDHPWHRGLWFSWKYINGLNYWEEDPATGLSEGWTKLVEREVRPSGNYSARIEMDLSYHPPAKPVVLIEHRSIVVSAPDEDGSYRIDWHSSFFSRNEDVLLDRTPIPGEKDGKDWGGYAGLSVRLAKSISAWRVLDSEMRRDTTAHGKKARWMDFSGETATGQTAGIAIFDHPGNMRHPTPWYVTKGEMTYFSPALLFNEPYTLPAGKRLALRYRILIHAGALDEELLEKEWNSFAESSE